MPIPIMPVNQQPDFDKLYDKNSLIDYSILNRYIEADPEKIKKGKMVEASNKDAELLMNVWKNCQKKENKMVVAESVPDSDFQNLKSRGLLAGNKSDMEITALGKKILKTMVLGESNKFLQNKKKKSYKEILAENSNSIKKNARKLS